MTFRTHNFYQYRTIGNRAVSLNRTIPRIVYRLIEIVCNGINPMTLVLKLDLDMVKIYHHTKSFYVKAFKSYSDIQTDTHTDRHTDSMKTLSGVRGGASVELVCQYIVYYVAWLKTKLQKFAFVLQRYTITMLITYDVNVNTKEMCK